MYLTYLILFSFVLLYVYSLSNGLILIEYY